MTTRIFGKPSGIPDPIKDVMQNKFGNESEIVHRGKCQSYSEEHTSSARRRTQVRSTKAMDSRALLVRERAAALSGPEKKELFKMTKFKNVECRVDTRRN